MKTGARNFQQGQSETYDYKTLMFRSRLDSIKGKKTIEMLMLFKDRNKKKYSESSLQKKKIFGSRRAGQPLPHYSNDKLNAYLQYRDQLLNVHFKCSNCASQKRLIKISYLDVLLLARVIWFQSVVALRQTYNFTLSVV